MFLCFILFPLAPLIIVYLVFVDRPKDEIRSQVTNKRSVNLSVSRKSMLDVLTNNMIDYYVTIERIEFRVCKIVYDALSVGDSIIIAYRKNTLYHLTR